MIPDEVDLHAGEAVIEKDQQRGLLLQADLLGVLLQAPVHDLESEKNDCLEAHCELT